MNPTFSGNKYNIRKSIQDLILDEEKNDGKEIVNQLHVKKTTDKKTTPVQRRLNITPGYTPMKNAMHTLQVPSAGKKSAEKRNGFLIANQDVKTPNVTKSKPVVNVVSSEKTNSSASKSSASKNSVPVPGFNFPITSKPAGSASKNLQVPPMQIPFQRSNENPLASKPLNLQDPFQLTNDNPLTCPKRPVFESIPVNIVELSNKKHKEKSPRSSNSSMDEPIDFIPESSKINYLRPHLTPYKAQTPQVITKDSRDSSSGLASSSSVSNLADDWLSSSEYTKAENAVIFAVDGLRRSNQFNEDAFDFAIVVDEIKADLKNDLLQRIYNSGLEYGEEPAHLSHQKLVKVVANSDRLEFEAERIKFPVKLRRGGWAIFSIAHRASYLGTSDPTCLFRSSERQRLIYSILSASIEDGGAAIDEETTGIVSMYPLHMKVRKERLAEKWISFWNYSSKPYVPTSTSVIVRFFHYILSCVSTFYSLFTSSFYQPIDSIADYYGEEIAFYFAWLEFYTRWLIFPSILGFITFVIQRFSSVDGPLVPIYCVCVACWSTALIEMWQRHAKVLAHRWGVTNYETHEERHRIGYRSDVSTCQTGLNKLISVPFLGSFTTLCIYLMFLMFSSYSSSLSDVSRSTIGFDLLSTPLIYGFLIPVLDLIYFQFASFFNNRENYETDTLYYRGLTVKVFLFRFVICFISLFYYAFWDANFVQLGAQLFSFMIAGQLFNLLYKIVYPVLVRKFKTWRSNFYIEKHIISRESAVQAKIDASVSSTPSVSVATPSIPDAGVMDRFKLALAQGGTYSLKLLGVDYTPPQSKTRSEGCVQSLMPTYSTFEDYAEIIIQFGYVTFFSVAFPLAPLAALINNLMSIRGSAFKISYASQRPMSRKASSIGIWLEVMQFMSIGSVLTNCAVILYTSKQLDIYFPDLSEANKILAIFIFEHLMLFAKYLIHISIPNISQELQEKIDLEKFESDKAKHEQSLDLNTSTSRDRSVSV